MLRANAQKIHNPDVTDIDKIKAILQACLTNAERLLSAAKELRKPGQNHIAYHLAAMALEEIGKASMVLVRSVRQRSPQTTEETDDDEPQRADWMEDHERKLFLGNVDT